MPRARCRRAKRPELNHGRQSSSETGWVQGWAMLKGGGKKCKTCKKQPRIGPGKLSDSRKRIPPGWPQAEVRGGQASSGKSTSRAAPCILSSSVFSASAAGAAPAEPRVHFSLAGIDRKAGAVAQVMSRFEGLILFRWLTRGEGVNTFVRSLTTPRVPSGDGSPG